MNHGKALMTGMLCGVLMLGGCGDEGASTPSAGETSYDASVASQEPQDQYDEDATFGYNTELATESFENSKSRVTRVSAGLNEAGVAVDQSASMDKTERKIIYRASLEVVVDDFEGVEAKVMAIVTKHDGFLASSNISGQAGRQRTGHFVIRVPSQNFDAFMQGAEAVGDVRRRTTDSQEVTEEFVDLQSRIRNKQTEEERLIDLLKQATGKLEEVLKVEKELSRVRGEIETMQGRLRMLSDLTALATVTLNVTEIKEYVPDEDEAPGFATRIARSFGGSIGGIVDAFQAIIVGFAAAVPWLAVLAIPVYCGWRYARRHHFWRRVESRV